VAARFSVIVAALLAVSSALAQAQQLQRLHVKSFILTSSAARPRLEVPFDVTLTIRVSERLAELQNVYLPTFMGAEELGDLREQSSGPSGTVYRETLRLVAHARGPLGIGSAYLDAIDARDGKPKRFISNDLHLYVDGDPAADAVRALRTGAWSAIFAIVTLLVLVAFIRLRNRPPAEVRVPQIAQTEAPPIVQPEPSEFEAALDRLRMCRDRNSVVRLRAALWRIAGARDGQTLSEVLQTPQGADEQLRRLLVAVERAAFVEERQLDAAIDGVLEQRTESRLIR
jgi:hypothetical protein